MDCIFPFFKYCLTFISQSNIFCYKNYIHILKKGPMSKSQKRFLFKQISILEQIVTKRKESQKFQISQITDEFNNKCKDVIPSFQSRSRRSIRKKIKYLFKASKHYWSRQINQIMMDSVSKGYKWKSISLMPGIAEHRLSSNQIKRKFQCGMRNKFKCLYKQAYNSEPPNISDVVFKSLIQQEKISQYYQFGILTTEQCSCLKNNILVFQISLEDEEINIRSKQAKRRIISALDPSYSLDLLIKAILKLNDQRKKKIGIQLNLLFNQNEKVKPSTSLANLQLPISYNHHDTYSKFFSDCMFNQQSIFESDNGIQKKDNQRVDKISSQEDQLGSVSGMYRMLYMS